MLYNPSLCPADNNALNAGCNSLQDLGQNFIISTKNIAFIETSDLLWKDSIEAKALPMIWIIDILFTYASMKHLQFVIQRARHHGTHSW